MLSAINTFHTGWQQQSILMYIDEHIYVHKRVYVVWLILCCVRQ